MRRLWRTALVVGVLVGAIAVGGYGYAALTAADQVYTGCLDKGTISNVAVGTTPSKPCAKSAVRISWNEQGPAGMDGASVTSATEPAGSNCANGGSKFTSVSGVTYACNGEKGDPGSGSSSSCTRSVGDAGTVAMYVTREESVLLSCETASGPQTLPVNEAIANEAADVFLGGLDDARDVPVTPICEGQVLVACPGGQPLEPAATLHVTNEGANYFRRGEGGPTYEISTTLLVKSNQPIPVAFQTIGNCSLNIDTAVGGIDTVDQAVLRWDETEGLTGLNRIHYDSALGGLDSEDFGFSGNIACATVTVSPSLIQTVISNSLSDQGPLCGAPGGDLFMRCPK